MADKISKLQRWLDLVAYLASRHVPATAEEVWAAVPAYTRGLDEGETRHETVRRMFERDKDELRAAGIPIETVTFSINYGTEESHGYRLARRDFHLPYLRLVRAAEEEAQEASSSGSPAPPPPSSADFVVHEDEATAALEGLRDVAALPAFPLRREARSAFRKLAFDLDPDLPGPSPVVYAQDAEMLTGPRQVGKTTLVREIADRSRNPAIGDDRRPREKSRSRRRVGGPTLPPPRSRPRDRSSCRRSYAAKTAFEPERSSRSSASRAESIDSRASHRPPTRASWIGCLRVRRRATSFRSSPSPPTPCELPGRRPRLVRGHQAGTGSPRRRLAPP